MKKTLTINLNGTVFNIDEDAYELLDEYLRNLRIYFRKEEGSNEIIADFESRVAELFDERLKLGYNVISIEQVRTIIEKIGNPKDFGDVAEDIIEGEGFLAADSDKNSKSKGIKKRLYRDLDDKMFGGVCSGIAAYFGWDATPLRISFFILIFVTSLWLIPVYIVLWLFLPGAQTAEQKLEMRGEEVTVENIGKRIAEPPVQKKKNFGDMLIDFLVSLMKVLAVGLGLLVGIPVVFALIIVLIVVFAVLFGVGGGLMSIPLGFGPEVSGLVVNTHHTIALIASIFLLGIPLLFLLYAIVAHFMKLSPLSKGIKWIGLMVWIIALAALIINGVKFINKFGNNFNSRQWHVTWGDGNPGSEYITGSGDFADLTSELPAFKEVKFDALPANIKLVQSQDGPAKVLLNGYPNIIDKINWKEENGILTLYIKDGYNLSNANNTIIQITTPYLEGVTVKTIGSVTVETPMRADHFNINMDGAGNFEADSLFIRSLDVSMEGVGSIKIAGTASLAKYILNGAGKISASELVADTVMAKLEGVGSIKSNPVKRLEARMEGIGKITYQKEPESKDVTFNGIGKIGLDN